MLGPRICTRPPLSHPIEPPNHSATQSLIYLCRARCNGGFCGAFGSPGHHRLRLGVLIKLKWCCKIYFIPHSAQFHISPISKNGRLRWRWRWRCVFYTACRRAYKLSTQITWNENWNCVPCVCLRWAWQSWQPLEKAVISAALLLFLHT